MSQPPDFSASGQIAPEPEVARTWNAYSWPAWVPSRVREQIQSFWSEEFGRGPQAWQENCHRYNDHPALGTAVYFHRDRDSAACWGRWVPCWNNMGRLVLADGSFVCGSTGDLISPERACAIQQAQLDARIASIQSECRRLLADAHRLGDAEAVSSMQASLTHLEGAVARFRGKPAVAPSDDQPISS